MRVSYCLPPIKSRMNLVAFSKLSFLPYFSRQIPLLFLESQQIHVAFIW